MEKRSPPTLRRDLVVGRVGELLLARADACRLEGRLDLLLRVGSGRIVVSEETEAPHMLVHLV